MKFNISGNKENYRALEDLLKGKGFEYCTETSGKDEPVYVRGIEVINLRNTLVIYESGQDGGFLHPEENVWLVDETSPSFPLIKEMVEILAPCEFPPPTNSVTVKVPDSLKRFS